jgi:two-component system sensor histidine kinase KdpD
LEQWAAVTGEPARLQPRHLVGPWGAVVVVDISSGEELSGFLLAPWEGRAEPTPAERDLLSLIGQAAASALEHAVLYARLQRQTDALNRLAAVQSDFLRGITHDLQTPLTSIRALAAGIGQEAELSDQGRADLEAIGHQADRLRRMVGQLLAVSRLDAGALEPRQEVFRVEPIVERTWEALRADRPFSLESEGPMQLAVGDPDRLEQVLWAVLDNAVKYSPGGSAIGVRVASGVNEAGPSLEIAVTDRGRGMTPAVRARAFEQFFRSDEARRAAPDGSGIGLYAARGLMEAMGGSIELDGDEDGTVVRIRLPAEPVPADEA